MNHAQCYHGRWYAEDCSRIPGLDVLKAVGRTFATSISRLPGILDSSPVDARIHNWKTKTHREFDPLEDSARQTSKRILCPTCRNLIDAMLLTDEGTGYFQANFTVHCQSRGCLSPPITKMMLAVRKLTEDLVRDDATLRTYLAGTLHTIADSLDVGRGKHVKKAVMSSSQFKRPDHMTPEEWILFIMGKNMYDLKRMRAVMSSRFTQGLTLTNRIFNAYSDDRIFSIDLVGAVRSSLMMCLFLYQFS